MNGSTPPFERDHVLRRRRRMKLIALGAVVFLSLEGLLLATLPSDSPHGGALPALILADALLSLAVCAILTIIIRKS